VKPGQVIAIFNHLPFPTSEIFRVLGQRREILHGFLGADVIGMHTQDYSRHFLSAAVRILGLEVTGRGVHYQGRFVHMFLAPVGIDPLPIRSLMGRPEVQARIAELREQFAGKKVVFGLDEIDVTKVRDRQSTEARRN